MKPTVEIRPNPYLSANRKEKARRFADFLTCRVRPFTATQVREAPQEWWQVVAAEARENTPSVECVALIVQFMAEREARLEAAR